MYISKSQAIELLQNSYEAIENAYKDKLNFLGKLLEDDDWSFVIKSHALIESLVTELIVTKLDEPDLKPIIERLPLHGDETSKIKIAKIYNLIPKEQITFISKLSTIRNNIVHKYENLNFTFDNYINNLNKDNLKNWKASLVDSNRDEELKKKIFEVHDKYPQMAVWLTLSSFINNALYTIHQIQVSKQIEVESKKTTENLLKDLDLDIDNNF